MPLLWTVWGPPSSLFLLLSSSTERVWMLRCRRSTPPSAAAQTGWQRAPRGADRASTATRTATRTAEVEGDKNKKRRRRRGAGRREKRDLLQLLFDRDVALRACVFPILFLKPAEADWHKESDLLPFRRTEAQRGLIRAKRDGAAGEAREQEEGLSRRFGE